jgi:manganese transport protein
MGCRSLSSESSGSNDMVPAVVVVALGIDATRALILSQLALSLVLPVPMVALLILTRRRDIMGSSAPGL